MCDQGLDRDPRLQALCDRVTAELRARFEAMKVERDTAVAELAKLRDDRRRVERMKAAGKAATEALQAFNGAIAACTCAVTSEPERPGGPDPVSLLRRVWAAAPSGYWRQGLDVEVEDALAILEAP